MFKYHIIFLFCIIQGLLQTNAADIKIVKAPYQAQVELTDSKIFLAHATILNCKWAVTIASAVNGHHPKEIAIRSGSGQLSINGGHHLVRNIYIHDNYTNDDYGNDLALLQIWYNFHLSMTVCNSAMRSQILNPGESVHLVGWWKTDRGNQLQLFSEIKSIKWEECEKMYSEKEKLNLPVSVFCTTAVPPNPGGYGQSLNFHDKLQGLLVHEKEGLPSVYVDISAHQAWIKEVIGKNNHYNLGSDKRKCEGNDPNCVKTMLAYRKLNNISMF